MSNCEKCGQELPVDSYQAKVDAYMERIKQIKWFQPAERWDKSKAEEHVRIALKAFGVEAEVEWSRLKTTKDWGAAWDAAWGAAWGAARDAAWGAAEIVVSDLPAFKEKYPNGAFVLLIPLWEMGLYPIGVVDGKFIIGIPENLPTD